MTRQPHAPVVHRQLVTVTATLLTYAAGITAVVWVSIAARDTRANILTAFVAAFGVAAITSLLKPARR